MAKAEKTAALQPRPSALAKLANHDAQTSSSPSLRDPPTLLVQVCRDRAAVLTAVPIAELGIADSARL